MSYRYNPFTKKLDNIGSAVGLVYKGEWDASTNTPTLTSGGTGIAGEYYVVSVAGTTTLDGISDWGVDDWVVSTSTEYQKIDNSEEAVTLQEAFNNGSTIIVGATPLIFQTNGMAPIQLKGKPGSPVIQVVDTDGGTKTQLALVANKITLDDENLVSSIDLSDASNTALTTTNQTLVGAINELNTADMTAITYYVNGDSGDNTADGLTALTAWKNFDNINSKSGIFGKAINRTVTISVSGTVRATAAGVALLNLSGMTGSGSINITGVPVVISHHTITGYQNTFTSSEGKEYVEVSGAGWTVGEHEGRFIRFTKSPAAPTHCYGISANTATKISTWIPTVKCSGTTEIDIVEMPRLASELISNPGVEAKIGQLIYAENTSLNIEVKYLNGLNDHDGNSYSSGLYVSNLTGNFDVVGCAFSYTYFYLVDCYYFGRTMLKGYNTAFNFWASIGSIDYSYVYSHASGPAYGVNFFYTGHCDVTSLKTKDSYYGIENFWNTSLVLYGYNLFDTCAASAIDIYDARCLLSPYGDSTAVCKFKDCTSDLTAINSTLEVGLDAEYTSTGTTNGIVIGGLNYTMANLKAGLVKPSLSMGVSIVYYSSFAMLPSVDAINGIYSVENLDIDTGTENVDLFDPGADGSATWHLFVTNGSTMTEYTINACWDYSAGTVSFRSTKSVDIGTGTGDLTLAVTMSGASGNVQLAATAASDNWTVKGTRFLITI
jgi:hypothetical protein